MRSLLETKHPQGDFLSNGWLGRFVFSTTRSGSFCGAIG